MDSATVAAVKWRGGNICRYQTEAHEWRQRLSERRQHLRKQLKSVFGVWKHYGERKQLISLPATRFIGHPVFVEIIRMGTAVIPFMVRDLERQPRLWVWALPEITEDDPVPVADRGDIAKMTDAWLRWAQEHGFR
jgi:hypothetical protein